MGEDEYLTAEQAAEKLQLHARTVRRLFASGELPGRKVGGKEWRISADALKAYVEGGQAPVAAVASAKVRAKKAKTPKGK
jgi:excisionase family DNA binding protein